MSTVNCTQVCFDCLSRYTAHMYKSTLYTLNLIFNPGKIQEQISSQLYMCWLYLWYNVYTDVHVNRIVLKTIFKIQTQQLYLDWQPLLLLYLKHLGESNLYQWSKFSTKSQLCPLFLFRWFFLSLLLLRNLTGDSTELSQGYEWQPIYMYYWREEAVTLLLVSIT